MGDNRLHVRRFRNADREVGCAAAVANRQGVPLDLSNREVLQQAQRQLKGLGFDPGSTDGTFGPQTEAALRAYQQAYRLPQTGRLDEATLRSLLPEKRQGALR